ncbi:MAG: glycosyltransferase family 2 protein [Lyngbya sp. HA4199-MV5]|jgi:cellulose synthase/poly-beta-1,6-N-acetylglucosamine synthase-like glycosyltransferase|nr:glycosyltransferase family 2 protein [Lyngbya sp. HA4199-MV5]
MHKISLYIPCYNVEDYIASCIEAVLKQTYAVDEILLIDDGCRDRTLDLAAHYPVRVIRHEVNKGLAAARNTAFHHARNELVASLDADCVPDPHWLERLVPLFDDETVAIAGGRLVETVLDSVADRWRKSHMTQDWGEAVVKNPSFMFGNNTLIRKAALKQIGGYNEQLRTNGEDADLSGRLMAAGYNAMYEPGAIVSHKRCDTVPSILDNYWRYWRFGSRAAFDRVQLKPFLRYQYQHFRQFVDVFNHDWQRRHYELLWLDMLLPFYMLYRDSQTVLQHNSRPIPSSLEATP